MWVKICGNTGAQDALKAAELGADAVGFVFAPSPRRVTAAKAQEIASELPDSVERVGVFGSATAEEIAETVAVARLHAVQLHESFSSSFLDRLGELLGGEISIIPVVQWDVSNYDDGRVRDAVSEFDKVAGYAPGRRVLVDSKVSGVKGGGTGKTFPWSGARWFFDRQAERGLWTILAGGLRPENVAEGVQLLRPWGVDVASGVEREPGRKDFDKMRRFIENARGA